MPDHRGGRHERVAWLDTSVLGPGDLARISSAVASWNAANRSTSVVLAISALAFAERLSQLRRRLGAGFDPAVVRASLARMPEPPQVFAYDIATAVRQAADLARRYPDDASWRAAKLRALRARGIAPGLAAPATVDWFIAGHADLEQHCLVTRDRGIEWESANVVEPEALISWLDA